VTVAGTLAVTNGGTGGTTQAAARTGIGASTVGSNFFTLTNPSAITFPRINADNTVSALDAATFRSAISAGTVTSVTVSAGSGLSGGGTVTSSGTVTLTNAGVTSLTAGSGISVSASTGGVTITNTSSGGMTEITSAYASSSTSYSVSLDFNTYKYYTLICTAANNSANCSLQNITFNSDTSARYSSYILSNTSNYSTGVNSINGISFGSGGSAFLNIYTRSGSALGGASVSGMGGGQTTTVILSGGYSTLFSTASITSIQFNATGYWVLYGVK
jgi:invasion protein IalB